MPLNVALIFFEFLVLIFGLSVHECAHAWMAWRLGDATAFMLGRVTLNPLKQLTWIGSVLFPLIGLFFGVPLIGWAKPTPVNPRNFRKYKRDSLMVTLAGPFSNLALALISLIILIVLKHALPGGFDLIDTAAAVAYRDPEVSTAGLPALFPIILLLYFGILTNVSLFLFNLLPIPPLDGSRVLDLYLPYRAQQVYAQIGQYGILIMYFVVLRTGLLSAIYRPVLGVFEQLLVRL